MPWLFYAALLVCAPRLFSTDGSVIVLSQIGCAIVFGLSFNMLLGQGGMLSFGHAVYSGMGAFVAAHAMNAAAAGAFWMPLPLVPLAGGVAGLLFSVVFGFVTTRSSGTAFAMITFGVSELVYVATNVFPDFFGGETGITASRVYGTQWFGWNFGLPLQTYYLIAAWVFVATMAMYAFTGTPLGRIINAVRDNAQRVAFIGYNAQRARYFVLMISGFFAGISGGLSAINFEAVTIESLSAAQSGAVLLFTFVGGCTSFAGPIVGAVVGTLLTALLSTYTSAWLLHLGLIFVLLVKFAPDGIVGLVSAPWRMARAGRLRDFGVQLIAVVLAAMAGVGGFVVMIEMLYQSTLEVDRGSIRRVFGMAWDTQSAVSWSLAALWSFAAALCFWLTAMWFARGWQRAKESLEPARQASAA